MILGMHPELGRLEKIPVSHEILGLIAEIDEFKGRWEALRTLSPERLSRLRHVATIESIGSSTRIEGARLSDREVEALLANLHRQSFRSRDEEEVAGYAACMDLVFQSWEEITLTENHIRQLHRELLRHSDRDEHHRGNYKIVSNHVGAFGPDGKELGLVFETVTPFATPLEMESLVTTTNRAIDERLVHPLIAIGAFVVRFLAIHPFQDGNGRISRVLTTLLLLRAGYRYVPFSSLESVIEENKDLYYAALRKTQGTFDREKPEWNPWLTFFLRSLKKQKDRLEAKMKREKLLAEALPELSVLVLGLLAAHERLSITDIERLTEANRNTLKVRLRELVSEGHIVRHGQARGTWYTRS